MSQAEKRPEPQLEGLSADDFYSKIMEKLKKAAASYQQLKAERNGLLAICRKPSTTSPRPFDGSRGATDHWLANIRALIEEAKVAVADPGPLQNRKGELT